MRGAELFCVFHVWQRRWTDRLGSKPERQNGRGIDSNAPFTTIKTPTPTRTTNIDDLGSVGCCRGCFITNRHYSALGIVHSFCFCLDHSCLSLVSVSNLYYGLVEFRGWYKNTTHSLSIALSSIRVLSGFRLRQGTQVTNTPQLLTRPTTRYWD